jgi:methylaspartate ammonia-lyase
VVPDFAATAELFDQVIVQRPDGIGYRLTADDPSEIIGPDALDLQRFTRELQARVMALSGDDAYRPTVYLALNGALGQFAVDPRIHFGRMLGPLSGLEKTLSPLSLLVEDPVRLEDPLMQIAVLKQLTEAVRFRGMSTRLVARNGVSTPEDMELCLQAEAVSSISIDAVAWGTVEQLEATARQVAEAGRELVVLVDATQPYQHLSFLAEVASAIGASTIALQVSTVNVQSISDLIDDLSRLR